MDLKNVSPLQPSARNQMLYTIIIPAYNEERNIFPMIDSVVAALRADEIPFEVIVVNDNSTDKTAEEIQRAADSFREVKLVHNSPPGGLGRAVRCGLRHFSGDAVAVVMADLSDSPADIVRYYRKLEEGYDCVYGSRFIKGSKVTGYPIVKLVVNRIVNQAIRLMFFTRFNDLTNAFKAYRRHVIESISPLHAAHFNITIEMSLSALIRHFRIAQIPICWTGKTWGSSNLRLTEMGRRYLCTLLKIWFERLLLLDDLMAEAVAPNTIAAPDDQRTNS